MYQHWIQLDKSGKATSSQLARIGGGWSTFVDHETSTFNDDPTHPRTYEYALRSDGALFRWVVGDTGSWKVYGSAPGFAAVKSMTMISKAAAYDTFLANTRGGALYTVRIPVNTAMKPVVTKVRAATWQGFETLVAGGCGNYGTVVVGIDKETKSAYLYTFGLAHGVKTTITGHGKGGRDLRRRELLPLRAAGKVRLALRRVERKEEAIESCGRLRRSAA
jgi:hypothetical protein